MKRSTPSGIIKFAFREGRHTKTSWAQSASREIAMGTDDAMNLNVSRAHLVNIKIAQVNEKGRILKVFPNLYHAASFAVETKLAKLKKPKNPKAAYGVYGNMIMCSRMGWKAYGFHWIPVPQETKVTWTRKCNLHKGQRVPTVLVHNECKLYFMSTTKAVRFYLQQAKIQMKNDSAVVNLRNKVMHGIKGDAGKFVAEKGYVFKRDGKAA